MEPDPPCSLYRVEEVVDPTTLKLRDGPTVRLLGAHVPPKDSNPFYDKAYDEVANRIGATTVVLLMNEQVMNGRLYATVYSVTDYCGVATIGDPRDDEDLSRVLVVHGYAYAVPNYADEDMNARILSAEAVARGTPVRRYPGFSLPPSQRYGLWRLPPADRPRHPCLPNAGKSEGTD